MYKETFVETYIRKLTGPLLYLEHAGDGSAAHESEVDVVSVFVAGDDGGDERVRPGVLVHVGRVHVLRELGRLVVLVLRVDAHGRRARQRRVPTVGGADLQQKLS